MMELLHKDIAYVKNQARSNLIYKRQTLEAYLLSSDSKPGDSPATDDFPQYLKHEPKQDILIEEFLQRRLHVNTNKVSVAHCSNQKQYARHWSRTPVLLLESHRQTFLKHQKFLV